jgi:hypothetical protein
MGRTRRAVAAIAVVATLGTGTVAACTGPPPTQTDLDNLGRGLAGIGLLFVISVMDALGICWVTCLPLPTTPDPVTP